MYFFDIFGLLDLFFCGGSGFQTPSSIVFGLLPLKHLHVIADFRDHRFQFQLRLNSVQIVFFVFILVFVQKSLLLLLIQLLGVAEVFWAAARSSFAGKKKDLF